MPGLLIYSAPQIKKKETSSWVYVENVRIFSPSNLEVYNGGFPWQFAFCVTAH